MQNVVHKDESFNFSTLSVDDIYKSRQLDPGQISTFSGDMSAFKARGGKFVTYHGRRDEVDPAMIYTTFVQLIILSQLIASGNSRRFYEIVSSTMNMSNLDSFYRLFEVPGLNHCITGAGGINFGQLHPAYVSDDPQRNILLAVVDWVETGRAPDTITGVSNDKTQERLHCRYPQKSIFDGEKFICKN